jgi:hypothetical protein
MEFQKIKEIESVILKNTRTIRELKIENKRLDQEISKLKKDARLSGACDHKYGKSYEQQYYSAKPKAVPWSPSSTKLLRQCQFCDLIISSEHIDFGNAEYLEQIKLQF